MALNYVILHGALCFCFFKKPCNHAVLRTYIGIYRYMKKG
jgi:hypothetical protein